MTLRERKLPQLAFKLHVTPTQAAPNFFLFVFFTEERKKDPLQDVGVSVQLTDSCLSCPVLSFSACLHTLRHFASLWCVLFSPQGDSVPTKPSLNLRCQTAFSTETIFITT